MNKNMKIRQATDTDLVSVESLLKDNSLPFSDCGEHIDNFFLKEDKNNIIGIGGIEVYGSNGLIRSIVVTQDYRGKGVATEIMQTIKEKALYLGVKKLYLLTESANEYFEKHGFMAIKRTEAPETIMNTKQFRELCPSSAVIMYLEV